MVKSLACKPGVAGSIPGFSKNNDNKNQPPGWAFGCSRDNKPTKRTSYSTGLAQKKK